LLKTPAEQLTLRRVAGRIVLEPNKNTPGKPVVQNRKTQKIVLIQVLTNINGTNSIRGIFTPSEKENLQNALHQALIHGDIEDYVNSVGINEFNLSNVDEFRIKTVGTNKVYGKFIYEKLRHDALFAASVNPNNTSDGGLFEDYPNPASPNQEFFTFLRTTFLGQTGNEKYSDYYLVFCFGVNPYDMVIYPSGGYSGTLGQAQNPIGTKNVVLFKPRNNT
ncbi:hypothetical protein, partial [Flavobacterium oreochromis]